MLEKEKIDEKLIKKEGDAITRNKFRTSTNLISHDDYLIRKDSLKSGDFSEIDSNRISLLNYNTDGYNLFFNNNSETNSNEINTSHKSLQNLHKIKFLQNLKNEDEKNKSIGGTNNSSTLINDASYYFKTHYISYMCNLVSNSIGYESIWRFPYYFINAEGAVFFIPFLFPDDITLFMILISFPIIFLSSLFGFSSLISSSELSKSSSKLSSFVEMLGLRLEILLILPLRSLSKSSSLSC